MANWMIIFSSSHQFLFTFMVLIAGWVVVQPFHYLFLILNRRQRSINIKERGWPPSHLDADGDLKE